MKMLIVDDAPRKYARLVERLESEGFDRSDVTIVTSAQGAQAKLEGDNWDLLVMDILLPLREEGEPDARHSIDLITEIVESTTFARPKYLVGITADPDAARSASTIFSEQLWTIVRYSETDEEWLAQIVNCAVYARQALDVPQIEGFKTDLVVVCALQSPELDQVLQLPWGFTAAKPVDDFLFIHEGKVTSGGRQLSVAAVSCSRMGMVAAALTTARVIRALRPRLLAMTGICAGIQGKANLGDVVFVDPAWDWQSGKYLREADDETGRFLLSPHQVGPVPALRAFADQLRLDKQLMSDIVQAAPDEAPGVLKLVPGPVATGSAVVADSEVTAEIRLQHRDAVGIEMECYGFFAAAEAASSPRPHAMAFKAVCDFADSLKNDKYQRYASYTSARIMAAYIERYGHALISQLAGE
ncbi:hypothetical protein GHV40_15995 [Devosia sp. D6-9]|nr:hypothetical protein GHV40_15995 [Devosia sp. D6-9]